MTAFQIPIRVYHEDVDGLGIVYYANYLRFMERARTEWLRALNLDQTELRRRHGIVLVVASANIRYHRPARFNDALQVSVRITRLGRVAVDLEQTVDDESGETLCSATVKIACVDQDTHRPCVLPNDVARELETSVY